MQLWFLTFIAFITRILTHIRIIAMRNSIGLSRIGDQFFLADRLLSVLRRLFMEGNFSSLFVKYYSKTTDKAGFCTKVLKNLIIICFSLIILASLFVYFSYFIVRDLQALYFCFLLLPTIFFLFLQTLFSSILESNFNFITSPLANAIGNIASIAVFRYFKGALAIVLYQYIYALLPALISLIFTIRYFSFFNSNIAEELENNRILKNFSWELLNTSWGQLAIPISELIVTYCAYEAGSGIASAMSYAHKILQMVFFVITIPLVNLLAPNLVKTNSKEFLIKKTFLVNHVLCIFPTIAFALGFYLDSNVDIILMLKGLAPSLYFLTQVRLLNTASFINCSKNVNIASTASAISNVFFVFLLGKTSSSIIIANNVSVILQFLILFFKLTPSIEFDSIDYFILFGSLLVSIIILFLINYIFVTPWCFRIGHYLNYNIILLIGYIIYIKLFTNIISRKYNSSDV